MNSSLQFKTTHGADDKTRELTWYAFGGYNFAERFYFNAGVSANASSRFGIDAPGLKVAGVRWGLFPSVEGAWVVTNEKWLSGIKGLDYLRLNIGYDMTGNDDIDYTASRSYFVAQRMLGDNATGLVIGNIGNTQLQWETTNRITAGLESNLFNNRVHARANFFKSWTSNLLSLSQLAWTSGLKENWSNGGKLENIGVDASLSAKLVATKNWHWELGASVGHYVNEITALPNNNRPFETDLYGATVLSQVGHPVGVFYGWKSEGVYATSAEAQEEGHYILNNRGDKLYFDAGDARFKDNGDKVIDDADRIIIGNPNPDIYGNIFTSLNWKHFTLSAVMNYSLGNDIYNYQRALLEGGNLFINQTTAMGERWTTEGQQTLIPRVSYGDPMGNSRFSDRWIEDGSYLRLSSVKLSYHLPTQSTYLQGITIWGDASNLFTLTRYLGNNPECSISNDVLSMGIDRGLLSPGRSFSLGININL
jgi:hypothetical protein